MTAALAPTVVESAPKPITFRQAFLFWLKLGFISFGGPAGQISIMHQELVENRRWISERRFLHALNYCMLLPGPEAQQLATYIGWLMHRTWGGVVAGALFVLPSLLILIVLSWIYVAFGNVPVVAGLFYGIKPAVTAIVLAAAWRIGTRTLRNAWLVAIAVSAFVAIRFLSLPFPAVIAGAAAFGLLVAHWQPAAFESLATHASGPATRATALIDDALPKTQQPIRPVAIALTCTLGILLWAVSLALLVNLQGAHGTLPAMGWFFTKAAFVTFGGAYAVLPYVVDAAVGHFQWLTTAQMLDGLALGETTPGPLIMVVAFVGFVGAWTHGALDSLPLSGVAGALVATWFTFLPSFIFIFAGAPLIEATRAQPRITAALAAITAAVVGVIVNLGLFFAIHVFWPQGWGGATEWPAIFIAVAAALALIRLKAGVIPVIVACAVAGAALHAMQLSGTR
jgi:chromate transporter